MPKSRSNAKKNAGSPSSPHRHSGLRAIEFLLDQIGGKRELSAVEAAQEVIFDAWELRHRQQRVALARKALRISPLCADAYALLAQDAARDLDERIDFYRRGLAAGEEALGKATFRDDVGHFWGILETRPYMRARQGLAQALWDKGLRDEAVEHYQDMHRLNPGDNQGIRYLLIDCLLTLGRDDDAAALIKRYNEDGAAAWSWSRALLSFRRSGDSPQSRKALSQAISGNRHVAALLLGDKKMPRRLPDYISWGGKDEAVAYVHGAAGAWAATPGALAWLRTCQQR